MPTIGRIGSLEVRIFRNDHPPPHFHVFGNEFSAKFAIGNCELLSSKGRIRRRDIRAVEEWGQKHQAALYLNWDLARTGAPPQKIENMLHEIKEAVPHPDHTITVTWSDGARAKVSLAPFMEKGGVFEALKDPAYFVGKMSVLPGGIGLTWPNEVDFSADGLRQDAFPAEATGEADEPTKATESGRQSPSPRHPLP